MTQSATMYIWCDGGFGNRFNTLVGGVAIARECQLRPQVVWPRNVWCQASFEEIFDSQMGSPINHYDQILDCNDTINIIHENHFHRGLASVHPGHISTAWLTEQLAQNANKNVFYFHNMIPHWLQEHVVLETIYENLTFCSDLKARAVEIIDKNAPDGYFHGIHLRKTDFGGRAVDDQTYLEQACSMAPTPVFVCSDDPSTEQLFAQEPNVFVHIKQNYVEKLQPGEWTSYITENNRTWPANVNRTAASVREAIVDLLILSQSQIIQTHHESTFLQTARLLNKLGRRILSA